MECRKYTTHIRQTRGQSHNSLIPLDSVALVPPPPSMMKGKGDDDENITIGYYCQRWGIDIKNARTDPVISFIDSMKLWGRCVPRDDPVFIDRVNLAIRRHDTRKREERLSIERSDSGDSTHGMSFVTPSAQKVANAFILYQEYKQAVANIGKSMFKWALV